MVRRGWSTVELPSGWLQVIRGPKPPDTVRRPPTSGAEPRVSAPPVAPERRWKPEEVRAAASTRVTRLQAAIASLGPDDLEEKKVLDAALRKAKMQAVVPPVEDRIAQSMKFLERAKK